MKVDFIRSLYSTLLAVVCIFPSVAQNNEYSIDDSLYAIFERANKMRYQPDVLALADTMYAKSMEMGDKKAQCIALTIPVSYYVNTNDEQMLQQAVSECQSLARKNDYLQYYYYASSSQITWLLNHRKLFRALDLSKTMQNQAIKDQNSYGVIQSYRIQGHIYVLRRCLDLAIERYTMALEYMHDNQSDQDPASLYDRLAECYIRKGKSFYPIAMENIEEGIEASKTHNSRMQILMTKGLLLYLMGRTDEFCDVYMECNHAMGEKGQVHKGRMRELDVCYCAYKNGVDKAFALADSLMGTVGSYRMKEYLARCNGDYMTAYEYALLVTQYNDSIVQDIQMSDIAELNAEMNLLHLERQNERLQKSKRYSYIICFIFIVVSLVMFILFRNKRKYSKKLNEQNKELVKAREIAEAASRMKDDFVHNMSHEIRTPLNAIVGISQIMTMPDVEISQEEKNEYNNIICHNAELLTTLVNDILDLAALENGKYTVKKEPLYCNELCRLTIASVRHRCPANVNLYFTSDIPDDFQLVSDEKRIRQVLINFLGNALKHTEQGEIHLHSSYTADARYVEFSVTDTGPGIPADKIPVLFDRFVKLNTGKPGTGLGLNICRVIADLLGGAVSLDQTYTNGSRFIFTLPLYDENAES